MNIGDKVLNQSNEIVTIRQIVYGKNMADPTMILVSGSEEWKRSDSVRTYKNDNDLICGKMV